jgi:hypothetical protein
MSGKTKRAHEGVRIVVAVSYQPYTDNNSRAEKIAELEAQGWLFKGETERGLCFYMLK